MLGSIAHQEVLIDTATPPAPSGESARSLRDRQDHEKRCAGIARWSALSDQVCRAREAEVPPAEEIGPSHAAAQVALEADQVAVGQGAPDEWDSRSIHDPFVIVYRGKYWLYYKGAPLYQEEGKTIIRAGGVAIADRPEGPFVKSELNPVVNSGHETMYWPYREGVAGLVAMDGPEKDTVQYAPDGLNFEVKSHVQMPPIAGGPFCPDAFADNGDGRGMTWGLSHVTDIPDPAQLYPNRRSFLVRFDCGLHRDLLRPEFKANNVRCDEHTSMQSAFALREGEREQALALARSAPATINRAVG